MCTLGEEYRAGEKRRKRSPNHPEVKKKDGEIEGVKSHTPAEKVKKMTVCNRPENSYCRGGREGINAVRKEKDWNT